MAKSPRRALKVFQAQFGFFDSVVAAPSQAEALRVWDAHQNLFASGDAKLVTDETTIAAALAHPLIPLRRAVGSSDAFLLKPSSLPNIPDAPKPSRSKPAAKAKAPSSPKPAADRSKLDAAEKALKDLETSRKLEEDHFRQEQAALETRWSTAQSAYVKARKAIDAERSAAQAAYLKAGGED